MEQEALRRIAALVNDLPALPTVAQEALALLSDPRTEPEELQTVLSRDPALALKVLRLANSAYYRRKREITTLTSSILLLGFKSIQTLILSSAFQRVLSTAGNMASALWDHCFATALGCRELGREIGLQGDEAEAAFLVGLFHDAAKGVIASKFPGVYARPIGAQGEVEMLGFHHGQLGQVLLAKWEIPPALAVAVGSHHDPEPQGLGRLAAVADWLAWSVAPGIGAEKPATPEELLAALRIERGGLGEVSERLASCLAEERNAHG